MPRVIDFGEPYGTREFPDNATDQDILAEYDRVRTPPTTGEYLQQAGRSILRGAGQEIASLPKAVGIAAAELRRKVGYVPGLELTAPTPETQAEFESPQGSAAYQLGQQIEKGTEAISPAEVPALKESFLATQIPQAVGSGLGFLIGGAGARLLRKGVTKAATLAAEEELAKAAAEKGAPLAAKIASHVAEGAEIGTLGATSQFQSAYEDAISKGADRDTALKAGLLNLPIGATEAIPLSNMLRRLDRFSNGGFTRYLITAAKETFEEGLQEAAQNFASNAVEKNLYNPAKNLLEDVAPQGAAGGAAGFLLSTLTQALGGAAARLRKGQLNAQSTGTQTETGREPQAPELVPGEEGRLRVRNAPEYRMGAASAAQVETALKPFGIALSPQVTTFSDTSPAAPAARTNFDENNVFKNIELNLAKLPNEKEVQDKFTHEVAHVASDSGALSEPLNLLTPQERGDIALEMSRLGYPTGSQNEFDARGTEALARTWADRTWFGQLVGRVTAWANETLGLKLTRRAAEAITVRAVGRSLEKLRVPAPRQAGGIQLANAFLTPPGLTRAEAALTAHHGTPHEIPVEEGFRTSKIGTGEGAQVYGWGLYFAQNPEVSRTYAENLAASRYPEIGRLAQYFKPGSLVPSYGGGTDRVLGFTSDDSGHWQAEVQAVRQRPDGSYEDVGRPRFHSTTPSNAQLSEKGIAPATGNQYTVSINANEDELLDWDKRLSEQPTIAQKLQASPRFSGWQREIGDASGHDLYNWMRTSLIKATGRNVAAAPSKALANLGIKGIRYLDQGSRGRPNPNLIVSHNDQGYWVQDTSQQTFARLSDYFKTEAEARAELERLQPKVQPTYNYVIFDENDINITHRNGQPVKPSQLAGQRTEEAKAAPVAPPPIQGVQVAGAAAQLGRVAEEAYAKREAATTQLSGLAYERQQYKAARQELRRLSEVATGRFFQQGFSVEDNPEVFPNPDEGVRIEDGQVVVGPEFDNKLFAAGVPYDPANTRAMQGEIYYEKESQRLVNLRSQIDLLQRAVQYYVALGVPPAEIKKVQDIINKISGQATALSEAQWNGKTIGERANEIEAAESARPALLAQRRSLGLEPVTEFFGRQVGGFRAFVEKAQQGLRVAAALRDKATTPEELRAAIEQTTSWLVLPEEVRDAVLSGKGLTDEQRGAAFASLASAFEDFDIQRQQMGALRDSRTQEINKAVKPLMEKISSAKITEGTQQVLVADLQGALKGETAGTGTLQDQATSQKLADDISAVRNFALKLGENLETNGALFDWITNPSTPVPVVSHQMATALGVSENTLKLILSEVKKSPAFGSAIITLINAADKKLANLPVVQVQEIQKLIQAGDTEGANKAAAAMISSAKARASLAATSQRQNVKELEALDIERQALDEGNAMFNEVAASPEYRALRDAVSNSPYGLTEPMDVANNTSRTFRPFGTKETPSHPGVTLSAADSTTLKAEDYRRVWNWRKAAQEHLDAYDAAQALYLADPTKNPSPSSLGFDLPVVRGLRDAVSRSVAGSAPDLSTQDPGSRWKVPWLVRYLNRTSWFRQHDFVAKMVGGSFGIDLRSKLGDWINHFLIARSVSQRFRDIPDLRYKALKSHPEVQMNMQLYRDFWNELAHWGRIFGSPLRVGFVLPGSGRVVTAEDLALLRRQTQYEEALRRNVTETAPVLGVRLQKGNRTLVRPGAYVGDLGLPRHLNRGATSFIADVVAAYGDGTGFDAASDLTGSSTDPVVAFWNQRPAMLTQHVLDSTRQDRSMRLDPLMAQTERTAAADWITNGVPKVQSVDELVSELMKHFPPAPGLNVREQVTKGLNDELRQYRDEANRIENDRAEKDAARNTRPQISFTADNEFTRPAANLALPSSLYDYGALSDADHLLIQNRANHERVVAYATALQRARADLQDRIARYEAPGSQLTEKEAFNGQTVDEAKDVLGILSKIQQDFEAAYKMGSPLLTQGGAFKEATGLLTSAVLALPTVNLRNMTQGQFEVYTMSRAMGLGGERLMFWQALVNMPKTLIRYALHIGSGLAKRTDLGAAMLTGKNYGIFTKLVDIMAHMLFNPDFRTSADRIHQLGYDTRDGFLDRLRRLWQQSAETSQREELGGPRIFGRRAGKLLGIPHNALRALFDTIGVQESDLTINAALLNYTTGLEKRLQEVAMNYGAERERQGLKDFDPTDPRWRLKPSEWSSGNQQRAKDSLALFNLFMEQAASAEGFQLEKNLWDYYQKTKAGQSARLFTDRQFDATERALIAQFNASTPANRSSAAAGNNVIRNLLTLQGYTSDGLLKLINTFMGGTRDRKAIATIMGKLPVLAGLALMSILIGYVVGGITGGWEKYARGRQSSLPNPIDKDFYTSLKRWGEGTARLSLGQLFYLGDVLLALKGEISGNRGFDPVGRVFPISLAQRFLGAVRGMWSSAPQASVMQRLQPGFDVARSMIPWYTELERAFGNTTGIIKQSQRVWMGEAQNQDLLPERRSQPLTGPQYGPTTIIRRDLTDALSRYYDAQKKGNESGAAQALETAKGEVKKLEDYYASKYVKAGQTPEAAAYKAHQDVWRDYQELNPVVAGMLGKRPTKAEFDLIRGAISGDRGQAVDEGIAAWQAGAQALFGRAAPVTREDVAASRASVGAGRASLGASVIPRGGITLRGGLGLGGLRAGGLRRGGGVSAPRLGVRRVGGALRRTPVLRGPRALRPRLRRLAGPRVRPVRINGGRRRTGLLPRRRRRQSVA